MAKVTLVVLLRIALSTLSIKVVITECLNTLLKVFKVLLLWDLTASLTEEINDALSFVVLEESYLNLILRIR